MKLYKIILYIATPTFIFASNTPLLDILEQINLELKKALLNKI